MEKNNNDQPSPRWLSLLSVIVFTALALWSANALDLSWGSIAKGVPSSLGVFSNMIPPNMEYLDRVLQGMLESLHMALLGTVLATVFAVPVGFLAAKTATKQPALYRTGMFLLNIIRTLPVILLAIIIMPGVGPGPLCGVLAMSIHSLGMLGKLFAEVIDSSNTSTLVVSTRTSRLHTLYYDVFPKVWPKFVSLAIYRLETNIRVASVLGLVGAGGIGQLLLANLTYRIWPNVGTILIGIILMVTAVSQVCMGLRNKIS